MNREMYRQPDQQMLSIGKQGHGGWFIIICAYAVQVAGWAASVVRIVWNLSKCCSNAMEGEIGHGETNWVCFMFVVCYGIFQTIRHTF